jgi:hypothetical protein
MKVIPLSVSDEGYFRNALGALNLIFTFLLHIHVNCVHLNVPV